MGGGKGSSIICARINELCHYITDYIITNIFVHVSAIDRWGSGSVCLETRGTENKLVRKSITAKEKG